MDSAMVGIKMSEWQTRERQYTYFLFFSYNCLLATGKTLASSTAVAVDSIYANK